MIAMEAEYTNRNLGLMVFMQQDTAMKHQTA